MNNTKFKALIVSETENNEFEKNVLIREVSQLPEADVLINVKYSSLNYKDALSSTGNRGVTKNYPHTPGIDGAGVVVQSSDSFFKVGDEVLVTGYDLGMNTSGGYAEYIRVPSEWVVKLPKNLSLRESMIIGTAGFTAALSIYKMIRGGVKPGDGEILVTGATGGVGSVAISILKKLGYSVIASTGKLDEKDMLMKLGASDIIDRNELNDLSGRPVLRPRWAGVIDTVGGNTLSTAIKTTNYCGVVTCCGNVADHEFKSSVYPFILKGVSLIGVDSVKCPMDIRVDIWNKLSNDWKIDNFSSATNEISLYGLNEEISHILNGTHKGRTIVNLEL